jgi:hypothetical protein
MCAMGTAQMLTAVAGLGTGAVLFQLLHLCRMHGTARATSSGDMLAAGGIKLQCWHVCAGLVGCCRTGTDNKQRPIAM